MRILVTAGYNRSQAAIAICEHVKRSGHEVAGILVVTPYSVKRIRELILQRGKEGLQSAVRKLLSMSGKNNSPDYLAKHLESLKIESRTLSHWATKNDVSCKVTKNINSDSSVKFVCDKNIDALIYGGGGILRKPLIDAANRAIINSHCGPLPEIRGMNAIEWALLLGVPLDVTVHFIDEGIDTGEIISRVQTVFHKGISVNELREKAVITGICEVYRLLKTHESIKSLPRLRNAGIATGRQCYVMAPALQELVAIKLQL